MGLGVLFDAVAPSAGLVVGLTLLYRSAMSHRTPVAWLPSVVDALAEVGLERVDALAQEGAQVVGEPRGGRGVGEVDERHARLPHVRLPHRAVDNFFELYPDEPYTLRVSTVKPATAAKLQKLVATQSLSGSY